MRWGSNLVASPKVGGFGMKLIALLATIFTDLAQYLLFLGKKPKAILKSRKRTSNKRKMSTDQVKKVAKSA